MSNKKIKENLRKSKKEFKNINNLINLFKFEYEKKINLLIWLLGIGITLLVSPNMNNFQKQNNILYLSFLGSYILGFILILLYIGLTIKYSKIQTKIVRVLYKYKDSNN